jgi:hypothetical protein
MDKAAEFKDGIDRITDVEPVEAKDEIPGSKEAFALICALAEPFCKGVDRAVFHFVADKHLFTVEAIMTERQE